MRFRQYTPFLFVLFLCATAMLTMPRAAQALSIIRDSEIEASLQEWMQPLLKAAKMKQGDVKLILVNSNEINAFVAGGRNIFLYTGLINEATHVSEVIGVLAHELGHIEGGHLIRMREEMEMASYQSMLAGILGIGIAVAGGSPEIGTAIYSGGATAAGRNFLTHSRTQESSADQAALRYFETAGYSPKGLVSFMQKLEGQEMLSTRYQSEYMRTHPITSERVQAMQSGLSRSAYGTKKFPSHWQGQLLRMQAKIQAYIDPARAKGDFGRERDTIRGRYALAIADYRQGRMGEAQKKVASLIAEEPENPYFHELMGQIQLESGRVDEAIKSYETALKYAPDATLVRIDLAQAYIQKAGQDDTKMLQKASQELMRAAEKEARTPRLHRLAATVQGRLGNDAYAQLHLAEEAVLQREFTQARRFAKRAEVILNDQKAKGEKTDRGAWLRTQDILQYVDNKKD